MLGQKTNRVYKAMPLMLAFVCSFLSVVCLAGCTASESPSSSSGEQGTGGFSETAQDGSPENASEQREACELAISAHSPQHAEGNFQTREDGSIVLEPIVAPSAMEGDGCFTGYAIQIGGSGIERIQAHTDAGLLCKLDEETIVKSAEPDKWKELASWKPTKRGTGEYFGAYDFVGIAPDNGKEVFTDPDAECGIVACKVLGQTVDLDSAEGALLSFWLEPEEGSGDVVDFTGLVETLSGAQLTVTATYGDGTVETQVVTLSPEAGDVQTAVASGNIALVGTVESLGDVPFPFESEPVNVYGDKTLPAAKLPAAASAGAS